MLDLYFPTEWQGKRECNARSARAQHYQHKKEERKRLF
jgi:hypothetical protein